MSVDFSTVLDSMTVMNSFKTLFFGWYTGIVFLVFLIVTFRKCKSEFFFDSVDFFDSFVLVISMLLFLAFLGLSRFPVYSVEEMYTNAYRIEFEKMDWDSQSGMILLEMETRLNKNNPVAINRNLHLASLDNKQLVESFDELQKKKDIVEKALDNKNRSDTDEISSTTKETVDVVKEVLSK